jgi:hypothetical protein
MKKDERITKIIKESLSLVKEAATATEGGDVFELLDEARTSLQEAQSNFYIKMPQVYQSLYASELESIYNHINQAVSEVQALAKKIHEATGK